MARPEGKGSKKDRKANGAVAVNGKAEVAKAASSKDGISKKGKIKEGPVAGKGKGKAVERAQDKEDDEELDEAALLLREIQSLGGDEADFEFLKDVDNQGEEVDVQGESSEPADDKKLAKELKAFMATLGDLQAAQAELSESDEEEEEARDDDEDDDDDSEDSTSEEDAEIAEAAMARASEKAATSSQKPVDNVASSTKPATRSGMLVDPHPVWYRIDLRELPDIAGESTTPTPQTITALQTRATQLLTDLSETFSTSLRSSSKDDQLANSSTLSASDRAFISTILQNGTSSDKLSALILLSSSSPLHTTTYLSQLMGLTKKKSRDEAVRAVRAIVDWLKGGQGGGGSAAGLPDRKLRWFADQPDLHKLIHAREGSLKKDNYQLGDEHLLVWAFEDWLKKWYFELLQAIETLSHDPLPFVRNQMVGFLAALLSSKPEQEQNLLRLLVDKLGDSDKTVSSRTSYHLLQLLQAHPMMKTIIVREVASIVLKPTNAPVQVTGQKIRFSAPAPVSHSASLRSVDHSKYYGIITLNQIMLTRAPQDKAVANRLIEIYFDIFKDLLGTHGEFADDISASKGPELKDRKRRRDEKKGKFAKGSAKDVLRKERRQQEKSQQALEAESKMMAAVLTGVNRAFPYSEIDGDVLHQRVDILFRIIHTGTFNVGIQALMLIFQVSSRQQAISDRFYRILYDTLVDSRLAVCSKQAMYLNLVFKAIKADTSSKRVAAFVKRITQILAVHQPPFVCGALYLLGELFGITPSLRSMCTEPEDADDDVENFKDAPDDSASDAEATVAAPVNGERSTKSSYAYDARKRDPQFTNAHKTCLWEISPLLNHFHPSVALHASQLLASVPITTTPDLELHTVSHFLDRFVYRNPKKKAEEGGKDSIMKPGAKGSDRSGLVLMRKGVGSITEGRVNADKFIEQASDKVPVDQLFFHKFFNQSKVDQAVLESKRDKRKRKDLEDVDGVEADSDLDIDDDEDEEDEEEDAENVAAKKTVVDDEDGEASEGELDEDEVWKAMQANMPDAGEDDADLLQDSGDEDVDGDEVDDAEFAYSDSELGVDEDAVAADKAEASDEEDDEEEEEEEEEEAKEPKSFFPVEEDDDELEGFAEEDDDIIDSDEDIAIDLPEFPASAKAGKKKDKKSAAAGEPKNKKRKLKHLPAFASADDWAEIINMGNEDEDL